MHFYQVKYFFVQKTYSLDVRNKPRMTNNVGAAENLGSSEYEYIIRF